MRISPTRARRASIRVEDIDPEHPLAARRGHCLRDQALSLCGPAQKAALGADVQATSLETLRHLVSAGQGATLAPLLAYADWRRMGEGLEGLRIVGGGASRRVRLVFRRGSPRRVALEALAASLRSSAAPAIGEAMRALASGRLGQEAIPKLADRAEPG